VVTFDITPHNADQLPLADLGVRVSRLTSEGPEVIAEGPVGQPAFDHAPRARLTWAWDTTGLDGEQRLRVHLDPDDRIQEGDEDPANNVVTLTVSLRPAAARPALEAQATWVTTTTSCCVLHYLTGSPAARDLPALTAQAEQAAALVQTRLHLTATRPISLYLVSRVIGQGGYAAAAVTLSYLDRNYAGRDLRLLLPHEFTHMSDGPLANGTPSFLREGLAVWVAGGHFKPEPIPQRAAALRRLGDYVPLDQLMEDFYLHQHEAAYLESAAFVAYLVETHGWDRFLAVYGGFGEAKSLDAVLQATLGADLTAVEADFLRWLDAHPPTPAQERDVRDTIRLFDAVRRYQQAYDPGAYFMSGWFPDPVEGERRGIVADFLRRPTGAESIALEVMLLAAQEGLAAGDLPTVETHLEAVEAVLMDGRFTHPLAVRYLAVVEASAAHGYEAQRVALDDGAAHVWATASDATLVELQVGGLAQ